MKILYISAEHVSGTLSLLKEEHERRGDTCRFVTFWHSRWDFPDDICLNLPLMPDKAWVRRLRELLRATRVNTSQPVVGKIPYWNPGFLERLLFSARDRFLWPQIERAIHRYDLGSFDIVQLDGGLDFTRDSRFVHDAVRRGCHISAFYHGSDFRTRGVIPVVDELAELRMTSEWDLLEFDPRLKYLYLPFPTATYPLRKYRFHSPIRICHASRNQYKGTTFVERAIEELSKKYPIEYVLLRDLSHDEALHRKYESDIFIDQLTNAGGWGYGMSSVEALAMGLPVITNIPEIMQRRLGAHPFVQATTETITPILEELIQNEARCAVLVQQGREWVQQRHDIQTVADQLYGYYREVGWMSRD